jgi:hypothetical protein
MTMEEQASALQASYTHYHRMTTQPWRTAEDRAQATARLTDQLAQADATLQQPPAAETPRARSQLMLWAEMVKGTWRAIERRAHE